MSSRRRLMSEKSAVEPISDRYDYVLWKKAFGNKVNPFLLYPSEDETKWSLLQDFGQRSSWFSKQALQFLHDQLTQLSSKNTGLYYIKPFMTMRKTRADARTQIRLKYALDMQSGFVSTQIRQGYADESTQKIVWRVGITDADDNYSNHLCVIVHKDYSNDRSSILGSRVLVEMYHPQIREMVKWPVIASLQQQLSEGLEEIFDRPCIVGFLTCHEPPKELMDGMFPFLDTLRRSPSAFYFVWNLYLMCERLYSKLTLPDVVLTLTAWYTIDADVRRKYYVRFVYCLQSFIDSCEHNVFH